MFPSLFSLLIPPPPTSTLFPYTTLFRSGHAAPRRRGRVVEHARIHAALAERTGDGRSEEHTSELQSHHDLVCRLLLEKKKSQRCINSHPEALTDTAVAIVVHRHFRQASV